MQCWPNLWLTIGEFLPLGEENNASSSLQFPLSSQGKMMNRDFLAKNLLSFPKHLACIVLLHTRTLFPPSLLFLRFFVILHQTRKTKMARFNCRFSSSSSSFPLFLPMPAQPAYWQCNGDEWRKKNQSSNSFHSCLFLPPPFHFFSGKMNWCERFSFFFLAETVLPTQQFFSLVRNIWGPIFAYSVYGKRKKRERRPFYSNQAHVATAFGIGDFSGPDFFFGRKKWKGKWMMLRKQKGGKKKVYTHDLTYSLPPPLFPGWKKI